MRFSAFSPLGLYKLSGKPSPAESIYRALKNATRGAYAERGHADASLYARAMALGRSVAALERAENQNLPRRVTDLLPAFEAEYGLAPAPGASLSERRAALAARVRPPEAHTRPNLETALRRVLGQDFVAYETQGPTPPNALPFSFPYFADNGPGLFVPRHVGRKVGRLAAPLIARFDSHGGAMPAPLVLEPVPSLEAQFTFVSGDRVVVDPSRGPDAGLLGMLASSDPSWPAGSFRVYPRRSYAAGAIVVAQRWPYWVGLARRSRVVVTPRAAQNAALDAAVYDVMREYARAVSEWEIVSTDDGFILEQSLLDQTGVD